MAAVPDSFLERVVAASRSETGRVRASNQDACGEFARPDARLFVVADGMGGHRGGEVASRMAVDVLGEHFAAGGAGGAEAELRRAVEAANQRVQSRGAREPGLEGMGTTLVALWLGADRGACGLHVGDSRLYRLRAGALRPLTQDHTLVSELQRAGHLSAAEAARHPHRHVLTRSVGPEKAVAPDVAPVELRAGDRFLLCSDGLCGYVAEEAIARALASGTPSAAAAALVALADASGGEDNVTVLVVDIPA